MNNQDPTDGTMLKELELALLRGLNVRVTNEGRMDPDVELMRRKNGMVGGEGVVRLIQLDEYVNQPFLNPMHGSTQRESYRLGDIFEDTRVDGNLMVLDGR